MGCLEAMCINDMIFEMIDPDGTINDVHPECKTCTNIYIVRENFRDQYGIDPIDMICSTIKAATIENVAKINLDVKPGTWEARSGSVAVQHVIDNVVRNFLKNSILSLHTSISTQYGCPYAPAYTIHSAN